MHQTSKKFLRIASCVALLSASLVLIILIGVNSQPDAAADPIGVFIFPIFILSVPPTIVLLVRTVLAKNLTTKERLTFELLFILSLLPYIWWFKLPG